MIKGLRLKLTQVSLILLVMGVHSPDNAAIANHAESNLAVINIPTASGLSLADVLEATYQRNPSREVLKARLDEAAAIRRQANALLADDAALQVRHNTGQVGNVENLREWEWGVELPVWLPGQRDARRQVAENRTQSVTASKHALQLAIAGQLRDLLWTIRANSNQALLNHKAWQTARDLEQDVNRRVEAGELAHLDRVLARQETLDRQEAYLNARATLKQNFSRYRILTGLETIPAQFREQQANNQTVDQNHPGLADAMASVETKRAKRKQVEIERRDNPTVMVGTRHERPAAIGNKYENTIGVTVNIPLGLPAQAAPRIAAAESSLAQSQTERDLLKRELDISLQKAKDRLAATGEALELAQKQAQLARENLALTRRSFDLGETNLFDLLRVQAKAFRTELNLRQRKIELQANIAQYNQAVGVIP
ncbi:MAG: TolC family protein [Pseudomonadales bacterium]